MTSDFKDDVKEAFRLFWSARDYVLSHHPDCKEYEEDCYQVGKKRLCIGCFTAYPVALTILILWIFNLIEVTYSGGLMIGFIFGMIQLFSLTGLSDIRKVKILIKVCLGIGIGFFTIGIFSLPLLFILRLLLFLICLNIVGFFSFLRMRKIKKICNQCEHERDWENCPGFGEK